MIAAPYTPLPITHPARAYVPAHLQTPERLTEIFRQHDPIRVCAVGENTACTKLKAGYNRFIELADSDDWADTHETESASKARRPD